MGERVVDLTGTLAPGMWSYRPIVPDVPMFAQRRWATIEERGWEADAFELASLTGTYLETAKHLYPDAISLDQVPPERLLVDAAVVRVAKGPREHIGVADLEAAAPDLRPGDALLVATGWDRYWWEAERFVLECPHFERATMEWIVGRGVAILGGDVPCFDDPDPAGAQGVNTPLLESGALILAPLVNLGELLQDRVRLIVLPLKVRGACGAPCRAIALETG